MSYRNKIEYQPLRHREVFEDEKGLYIRWYGRVMRRTDDGLFPFMKADIVYVNSNPHKQSTIKVRLYKHFQDGEGAWEEKEIDDEVWEWQGEIGRMYHYIPRDEPDVPVPPVVPLFDTCSTCGLRMSAGLLGEHICDSTEKDAVAEAQKLAGEHWAWFGSIVEKVYKDAFVHGYKHGREDNGHTV